ncbi:MAG: O-antigen ligase family protein, partial [Solirubrobacteraceae bacterium]
MSAEAVQVSSASQATSAGVWARRAPLESIGWVALVALAPAAVIYLSFNAGGYFPSAPGFVAVVFAQALVLRTMLAARPFEGFSRALAIPLAGLVLYAAFQLTSALWSHATAHTLDSFARTLLYVLAFVLFGSVRYTRQRAGWVLRALVAGLAAVCLIGLISRVLPHAWPTSSSFFANRLNYPITYWNAEGMIAAIVLILGFHLSADRTEHWSVRVLAAAILPAIAATLLLTFSRGAMGVAAIGLLAYCLLTRFNTLPTALLAVLPPVAIALRSAWEATALATNHPTDPAAISQGHHVALVVGACMVGAGLLRCVLLLADQQIAQLAIVRTPPQRAVRVGVGIGAGLVILAVALAAGAEGFAHRQYDKFVNGTNERHVTQIRDRLTDPANDGRLPLWQAALDIYDTQKLRGTGAGTYQQHYPRFRTVSTYVVDAHSLYLQSLAELGVVGFVLILVVVLGVLGGLGARIRGPDRALYAALFAMSLAWAVHQAFDWDWQMPAVTLGVFILAGVALARPNDGKAGLSGLPAGRTLVALGWLVLAVGPLLVGISYARLQRSGEELKQGDCASARQEALSSLSLSAKRPQAYTIIGVCDLQEGFAQAAVPAMTQAAKLEPESWEEQYWLTVARAGAG